MLWYLVWNFAILCSKFDRGVAIKHEEEVLHHLLSLADGLVCFVLLRKGARV